MSVWVLPQELEPRETASRFRTSLVADVWFCSAIQILIEGSVVGPPSDVTTRENGS